MLEHYLIKMPKRLLRVIHTPLLLQTQLHLQQVRTLFLMPLLAQKLYRAGMALVVEMVAVKEGAVLVATQVLVALGVLLFFAVVALEELAVRRVLAVVGVAVLSTLAVVNLAAAAAWAYMGKEAVVLAGQIPALTIGILAAVAVVLVDALGKLPYIQAVVEQAVMAGCTGALRAKEI